MVLLLWGKTNQASELNFYRVAAETVEALRGGMLYGGPSICLPCLVDLWFRGRSTIDFVVYCWLWPHRALAL